MTRVLNIGVGLLAICGLVLIRALEDHLFYDPLLAFFRSDYHTASLPALKTGLLLISTALRYFLNAGFSLLLLWVLFRETNILRMSLLVYLVFFVVGILLYLILLSNPVSSSHFALFYARRFLIQPLLILVLIPAFYFFGKSH